jgi:N-acetylglucosamine-6-phosphate deacetylase
MILWGARDEIVPFWAGALVFSPFIVDATVTLLTRMVKRERFWLAHKTHFYQRLVGSREPGAVGAALTSDAACGIIVDGHHVHRASLRLAYDARPGGLFLVTDAMPPAGTEMPGFTLGGRWIEVREGRCTTADGRLAGSALDMAAAVRNAVKLVGIPLEEALRMASACPADVLEDAERGRIAPGMRADLVLLDGKLQVRATWIAGEAVWSEANA